MQNGEQGARQPDWLPATVGAADGAHLLTTAATSSATLAASPPRSAGAATATAATASSTVFAAALALPLSDIEQRVDVRDLSFACGLQ